MVMHKTFLHFDMNNNFYVNDLFDVMCYISIIFCSISNIISRVGNNNIFFK